MEREDLVKIYGAVAEGAIARTIGLFHLYEKKEYSYYTRFIVKFMKFELV